MVTVKKLLRDINEPWGKKQRKLFASNNDCFTLNDVVDLLSKLPELRNCYIGITKSSDGTPKLAVGNSVYDVA